MTSELLSPKELKQLLPVDTHVVNFISRMRATSKNILRGSDSRLLILVGPCSIHNYESAISYAKRLKKLAEEVKDSCVLIMRAYVEKPRSNVGWKGFCYDPKLDGSDDIKHGLISSRKLFLDLAKLEVPVATEFLDPLLTPYFEELITWGFIGARTAASQIHRQMASGLSMPVGFKNGVDGNLAVAVNGILTANAHHTLLGVNDAGQISYYKTKGNPDAHLVLRGSMDDHNFDSHSIQEALEKQFEAKINLPLLIDCAHGNSSKLPHKQKEAFLSILEQKLEGNNHIMGMMLESHIQGNSQPFYNQGGKVAKEISITDPCLDWESTKQLILWAHSIQIQAGYSPGQVK